MKNIMIAKQTEINCRFFERSELRRSWIKGYSLITNFSGMSYPTGSNLGNSSNLRRIPMAVGRRWVAQVFMGSIIKVQRNQICMARGMRYLSDNSTRDDSSENDNVPGIVVKTVDNSFMDTESATCNMESSDKLDFEATVDVVVNIWKKNEKFGKELFDMIISPRNLAQAWFEIKSRPGMMTQGIDDETLDGFSTSSVEGIHRDLKNRVYKYKPLRRVDISKPGKFGTRSLSISSPKDKVVQHAFKRVLEICLEGHMIKAEVTEEEFKKVPYGYGLKWTRAIGKSKSKKYFVKKDVLPPYFCGTSHGFRPGKSCHTALESIKKSWKDVSYFINIDISKAFDKVNHHRLFKITGEIFEDQRITEELRKMTKVGIINFNDYNVKTEVSNIGIAQGSSLSPLLFNMYMTKLDRFIESLVSKHTKKGGKKIHNPYFKKKVITFGPNAGKVLGAGNELIGDSVKNARQCIVKVQSDTKEVLMTYQSLSAVEKLIGISRKKVTKVLNESGKFIIDDNTYLQRKCDLPGSEELGTKLISTKALINAEKHRLRALNRAGEKRYNYPKDEKPRAIYYVRYADDFLLGINGPRSLAVEVKKEISTFISSDLHFECSKAGLHHALSDWVDYLGFSLQFRDNASAAKPGKEMEAIKRFQARAKKNLSRVKEQYFNSSVRLGKIAFFDQIHEHAKDFQTYMDKEGLAKAGAYEAKVALQKYFQCKAEELSRLLEVGENKIKSVEGINRNKFFAGVKEQRNEEALVSIGRELKIFGKIRVEQEGKKHLEKLLGPEMSKDFQSCLDLGGKLDRSKSKLVEIIQNSKDTLQGKASILTKPQTFGVYIRFPKNKVMERLKIKGLVDSKYRPISYKKIINADDITIIAHFDGLARGIINYYSPCHNFWDLRSLVDYHVRYSLLATLGHKHKGSITKAIKAYGKDPKVIMRKMENSRGDVKIETKTLVQFVTSAEIAVKTRGFRLPETGKNDLSALEAKLSSTPSVNMLSLPSQLLGKCAVKNCNSKAVEWHHVRKLNRRYKGGIVSGTDSSGIRLSGKQLQESALKRKQIPLCKEHHVALHKGDIDNSMLQSIYVHKNTHVYGKDTKEIK
uniref:Reverse transcriptase domain-containing protein n=1 Tax=Rhizaria sp. TaxID=2204297 RepID=A0A5P8DJT5_9EUKA|nr:hypothetical protein [Rhizaria sp.]